jgi:hypothetical protein
MEGGGDGEREGGSVRTEACRAGETNCDAVSGRPLRPHHPPHGATGAWVRLSNLKTKAARIL